MFRTVNNKIMIKYIEDSKFKNNFKYQMTEETNKDSYVVQ